MEQQEQQHVQKMRALFNSHVTRLEELLQQYHDVQMEIKASHKQFGVKSDALLAEFEDRIIAADDACTLIINDFVSGVSNMKVETEATMLKKVCRSNAKMMVYL